MNYDFEFFKKNISLPDFLRDVLQWKDVQGSTKNNPKMSSPDRGQTIVIKKNHKGHFTYFDVQNDNIKGATILDLMQSHILNDTGKLPSLRDVAKILQEYVESGKTILPNQSTYNMDNQLLDTEYIIKLVMNSKPLYDYTFWESRGFDRAILETKEWKNVFFQRKFTENNVSFNNTCVRLNNVKGVTGISQRNEAFKGCLGKKFDSVANSFFDKNKAIDKIHICESIFDGVAHFQMNYFNKEHNLNLLYLSTEGAITVGQISLLQNLLNKYEVKSCELNFDNDKAGALYAFKTVGLLDGSFKYTANRGVEDDSKFIYVVADIKADSQEQAHEIIKTLLPEEVFAKYYDSHNINFEFLSSDKDMHKFQIKFPYAKEVLHDLTEVVLQQKFNNEIHLVKPVTKDFNLDLQTEQVYRKAKDFQQNI